MRGLLVLLEVVGPDRLELSTSTLSVSRSNHLSYGPTVRALYRLGADVDKGFLSLGVIDAVVGWVIRLGRALQFWGSIWLL